MALKFCSTQSVVVFFIELFFCYTLVSGGNMQNRELNIIYSKLSLKGYTDLEPIKLIEKDKSVELLYLTKDKEGVGIINSILVGKDTTPHMLVRLPSLALSHQEWDINLDKELSSVAFTNGINFNYIEMCIFKEFGLTLKQSDTISVSKNYPFANFFQPRFVKNCNSPKAPIHCLLNDGYRKFCVVFNKSGPSEYSAYQKVQECHESVIIKKSNGYLLVFKKYISDVETSGFYFSKGHLHYAELNENFEIINPPKPLLDQKVVYEFDVSYIGKNLIIFAITEKGTLISLVTSDEESFKNVFVNEEAAEGLILARPSVLMSQSELHLAYVQVLKDDTYQIVTGKANIESLK